MKTIEIQTLITAATAALTPIMDTLEEPDSCFTREEKTKLGLAYYALLSLQQILRQQQNRAADLMPWEEDESWNS